MVHKITSRIPVFTALVMGLILLGSTRAVFASTASLFDISLPADSLDFSDLDVRDEFNRPIASKNYSSELQRFFTSSLTQLLLKNFTPSTQIVREILSKIFAAFEESFTSTKKEVLRTLSAWWSEKKKSKKIFQTIDSNLNLFFLQTKSFTSFQNRIFSPISSIISSTRLLR